MSNISSNSNNIQLLDQFSALERAIGDIYYAISVFMKSTKRDPNSTKTAAQKIQLSKNLLLNLQEKLAQFDLIIDELYIQLDAHKQEIILRSIMMSNFENDLRK